MQIENSRFRITIEKVSYSPYGEHYDVKKYFLGEPREVYLIKCRDIVNNETSAAVVGGPQIIELFTDGTIVNDDSIIFCLGDEICSFSIPKLELNWRTQCDSAFCMSVFKYNDGYIVHGELEITHLDLNGKILWKFSARDIFVTDREYDFYFAIDEGIIKVIDWQGYEYHINSSGECINEVKHE